MKRLMMMLMVIVMMGGMYGCGKTLAELRTDGDAIVDNAEEVAHRGTGLVGTIVKKAIAIGGAIFDIGKKVVEDSKDNVNVITNQATK